MSFFFKIVALAALGGTIGGSYVLTNLESPPPETEKNQKPKPKFTRELRELPPIDLS